MASSTKAGVFVRNACRHYSLLVGEGKKKKKKTSPLHGKSVYLGTFDNDDGSKVYNDQLFPRVQSALVTWEDELH